VDSPTARLISSLTKWVVVRSPGDIQLRWVWCAPEAPAPQGAPLWGSAALQVLAWARPYPLTPPSARRLVAAKPGSTDARPRQANGQFIDGRAAATHHGTRDAEQAAPPVCAVQQLLPGQTTHPPWTPRRPPPHRRPRRPAVRLPIRGCLERLARQDVEALGADKAPPPVALVGDREDART